MICLSGRRVKMATQTTWKSGLTCYALRLKPREELYSSLLKYKKETNLQAPFIMTCCGSLTKATLRLAGFSSANPNNVRNTHFLPSVRSCSTIYVLLMCCLWAKQRINGFGLFQILLRWRRCMSQ